MSMSGYDSSDSSWSDAKARRKSNGVTHPRLKKLGTNVHSSMGGGVSVHNALMSLEPPPANAKPGSEHAPWLRLTDWEMMMLRKRMKKNAKWRPSESMVKVELIGFGRGPHNYWEAKKKAEAEGVEFIDVDNIATADPDKPRAWGEVGLTAPSSSEDIPRNKGMALNEAKKRKRDEFLASASQRSSKNVSDDGLPPRKPTVLNSTGKRPRGRPPKKPQEALAAEPNHTASQYSMSAQAQIYTDSTSDDFQAGDEDDSDGSFDPYAMKEPHANHASEPLLGIQQEQGTPDFRDNKTLPNHIPMKASPGARTAGVSQHSQQSHRSSVSNNHNGFIPGQSSTRSEPPVLQPSPEFLSTAAARVQTTVSPQPSTAKRGNPLQQLLFSRPSTTTPTTDPDTSTASPANPLQRLLYTHPSRAISHPQAQSSPLWSDNAASRTAFDTYTSASSQPSTTVPKDTHPPQLYDSPSTVAARGPADAIRMPQKRRPGALFDHRESLSKIVGVKRPVPKPTHLPVQLPLMMQSPPMEPPQVYDQPRAPDPPSSSKPGPKPKGKPGPKPKAKPGPKPKGKPGPKPKPKPQLAMDEAPAKKRKYIPGGPGGGGRYVDI